ncbi:tyrosine-type recombinase/integrase [Aminicella lysinilytica]|uniref:Integrase-like protein n=1 Tax=Aminicella lysinilytica TaxID=433323 RepID=A0A4R6Q090_9FIRM|nr:tyrosine-type recombinase/integrase [Aminicella lysinilytica]TDP44676.1 integrase-like protein [Aminicella lysinilytica]
MQKETGKVTLRKRKVKKSDGKRRDSKGVILKMGEYQRPDGRYLYKYRGKLGQKKVIYATSLKELREKENSVDQDRLDGIRTMESCNVNDMFDLWCQVKRGLKDNTFQNYKYMYNTYVRPEFGRINVKELRKTDVKVFYNRLVDDERLRVHTLDVIQNILHQVLDVAVDDRYIRVNPLDNALAELKRARGKDTKKRKALTLTEQRMFLDYIKDHPTYYRWYPIFSFMIGTGMRVGEVTGLRWCDVDMEDKWIDVNHTLVYYDHGNRHCAYEINSTKTEAGTRVIPMLDMVKDALLLEKKNQEEAGLTCKSSICGYTDFIFLNRFGEVTNNGMLNKAISRIIRDHNDEELLRDSEHARLIPKFSCHSLRHTFTTRMIEAGVNIKVVQEILGHTDVSTTLNIYADATKDLKKDEFAGLNDYLKEAKGA